MPRKSSTPAKRARVITQAPTKPSSRRSGSRLGTKLIGGHFDRVASQQLKILAAENDTTAQELLREALNDLFVKYGRSAVA
jgi:hypothetical protein